MRPVGKASSALLATFAGLFLAGPPGALAATAPADAGARAGQAAPHARAGSRAAPRAAAKSAAKGPRANQRKAPGRRPGLQGGGVAKSGAAAAGAEPGSGAAAPPRTARQAESDLQALRERIAQVSEQVGRDALERDRLARTLREAELAVGSARRGLESIASESAERSARRAALALERERAQGRLAAEREVLAAQLRAAYRGGGGEALPLLLAGRDPGEGERLLRYHGYLGRARAQQLARIDAQLARIGTLDSDLAGQQQALERLRAARTQQLGSLEQGRTAREAALATLQQESQSRSAQLARLKSQQADLERLLRELARAARPAVPEGTPDASTAFGRQRGQLAWPASGHLVARYGEQRATGVDWDGVVIEAERGSPVRAVAAGRVLYADWLPGMGLLAIVDHGEGYFSLYGYNDQLRRAVGDAVQAGEVIASVGDSGGRPSPQLYFELRRSGKPLDPGPWFRRRAPD